MAKRKLLDEITNPHQLRRLSDGELKQLARELRERIVEVVSRRGGHLASNLGTAELAVALHYVFDFSRDRLLWDVGHQCYAHKILTGRGGRFDTLRQAGGISGYPEPAESPYDLFATGHAGTAISTAAGLAWADQAAGADSRVVAVVGDASIVNGLALEGINNAALLERQFLIILNDNSMAIDRTRGALSRVLDRVRLTQTYDDIKHSTEQLLSHLPMGEEITDALRHVRDGVRTTVHGGQVFEALGFRYFGPVDGHDIPELIARLKRLSSLDRPALLHVHTQKGRGVQYAVEDPCRFHSPSAYRVEAGRAVFPQRARATWTDVFADSLVALGRRHKRLVAVTAAMPDGTGLAKFRAAYPSRHIDVGINESHAVAMAAGLAKAGLRPVVAVYSTFLQRALDQIVEEVALQKLPVVFCIDRAGLVGSDGATHHGAMDIAYLRGIPGMVLAAPADAAEMQAVLEFALAHDRPAAIRYPRDEVGDNLPGACPAFRPGQARTVREGADGAMFCYGAMVAPALQAARRLDRTDALDVAVVNARFAKPIDVTLVTRLIASGRPLLVCEDHAAVGGVGSAVMELASARGLNAANVRLLGLPDRFVAHATRGEQLAEVGLDADHLTEAMRDLIVHPAVRTRTYL
jgi:1-deoxy-D-xylulose-5-phosphate synthase